jgi:hypothetical protein
MMRRITQTVLLGGVIGVPFAVFGTLVAVRQYAGGHWFGGTLGAVFALWGFVFIAFLVTEIYWRVRYGVGWADIDRAQRRPNISEEELLRLAIRFWESGRAVQGVYFRKNDLVTLEDTAGKAAGRVTALAAVRPEILYRVAYAEETREVPQSMLRLAEEPWSGAT